MKPFLIVIVLILGGWLVGCGQGGPLYLPSSDQQKQDTMSAQ